jgi:hypothetical protein
MHHPAGEYPPETMEHDGMRGISLQTVSDPPALHTAFGPATPGISIALLTTVKPQP